jgi:integrase/recombinase XerD
VQAIAAASTRPHPAGTYWTQAHQQWTAAQRFGEPALATALATLEYRPARAMVESAWSAVPGLLPVRFSRPLAEPAVLVSRQTGRPRRLPSGVVNRCPGAGDLAAAAFRAHLAESGYAPRSARDLVRAMARVSCWLEERGLAASELRPPVAADLVTMVADAGPVIRFLREIGGVPAGGGAAGAGPEEALLAQFRRWLAGEWGLSAATVSCYGKQARKFLAALPGPLDAALGRLDAGQVTTFMLVYCQGRNPESAKAAVTAVRALLRFLHAAGHVPVPLAAAVPAVAGWRLASLPRVLDAAVIERLLGSCDRSTVTGRRDYAILVLLARLGLRGAEAALRLADIDWHAGEAAVRGKGNRAERLPLPAEAREAIADYLTPGRPACAAATVFCTVRAPYRQLTPAAVRGIMGQACRRAGLDRVGAHRLRHSLATQMHADVDTSVIALWMGYQDPGSTQTYLHADMTIKEQALARVQPPGAAPGRYHPPDTLIAFLTSL